MKIRKNVVIGIVLMALALIAAAALLITPVHPIFALCAAVPFAAGLTMIIVGFRGWKLIIAWNLVAQTAVLTFIIGWFFGWWFLLPLAAFFASWIWVSYLLNWQVMVWVFPALVAIAITLFGVYGIVDYHEHNVDTLNVDKLVVQEATMATVYVGDEEVDNQKVTDQEVTNQTVDNSTVTNQKVENQEVTNQTVDNSIVTNQKVENQEVTNQTVTNQTVDNSTVTNQKVENQEVTNQTEPKPTEPSKPEPTEPKPTEPKPTEPSKPEPTEPKPTEPVHTHIYNSVVTEPTCMEQGYTTHTCTCGDSYKDSYKGALGHSYESKVVAPTTDAKGYTLHTCTRCGHSYKDAFTDKLVQPKIKAAGSIRYGETIYVNLEGISASNIKVSNKAFCDVEIISESRIAITLTEDVTGYITVTDTVSGTNVVIDIAV